MTLYDYLKMNNVKVSNKKQKLLGWIIRTIYIRKHKEKPAKTLNHSYEKFSTTPLNDYDVEFLDSNADVITNFLLKLQQNKINLVTKNN
jgi:hypothetical protein